MTYKTKAEQLVAFKEWSKWAESRNKEIFEEKKDYLSMPGPIPMDLLPGNTLEEIAKRRKLEVELSSTSSDSLIIKSRRTSTINPSLRDIAGAAVNRGLTGFSLNETLNQTVYINGKFVRLSERYNARGKVE
jgi:hypothetical protein